MKALARSYFWWPRLDSDIETTSHTCSGCQQTQKNPATAPLHPWEWPAQPWQCLHIDFPGPLDGNMFLIVVFAHSKWPEVIPMNSLRPSRLREIFAQHSIPKIIVSDTSTVHIGRVRRVRQGKRHSPHPKRTVPSSDQQSR